LSSLAVRSEFVAAPPAPSRLDGSVALPRVEVILSTYAARQEWLEQQLDSIWGQTGVDISLLVRDDGSPDDTADRVESLLRGRPARLVRGENVGPTRSFLLGLRDVAGIADYAAFCDQDDVWRHDKLARAVDALRELPSPAMYSARVELVDEQLSSLGLHPLHARGHSFANALVQSAATGCTIVLDRSAADLLAREDPVDAMMHDTWAYLVVTGCGTSWYDPEPVVRYRQHGRNVIGVASTGAERWRGRWRRHLAEGHRRAHTLQDRELSRLYGRDLRPEAAQLLARHLAAADAGFLRRLAWALRSAPHRQDPLSDLVYRLLFAVGRV
jgi:glycosyltransferase involved in cell wall biosynthesis